MLERLNFKICVFDLKGCWGKDAPEPMNFKIFMLLTYRGDGRGEAGGGGTLGKDTSESLLSMPL